MRAEIKECVHEVFNSSEFNLEYSKRIRKALKASIKEFVTIVTPFLLIIGALLIWIFNSQREAILNLNSAVTKLSKNTTALERTVDFWYFMYGTLDDDEIKKTLKTKKPTKLGK